MKRQNIIRIGASVFLILFLICLFEVLRPVEPGIRIPVFADNGKAGYIDDKGTMVIAAEWERAFEFNSQGKSSVTSEKIAKRYSFAFDGLVPKLKILKPTVRYQYLIDRAGRKIDKYQLSGGCGGYGFSHYTTKPDTHGMSMVHDGSRSRPVYWIMENDKPAFPGEWDEGINFKDDDPAAVRKDGKWGFINRMGETVIPFEWDETRGFNGGDRACVSKNHKWGIINSKGEPVVPLMYDHLEGFDSKNMCLAHQMGGGSGFIDPDGRILIPLRFLPVKAFDRFDMAQAHILNTDGKRLYGWIDRSGKTVIPFIHQYDVPYESEKNFVDHELLPVSNHKDCVSLIDRTGRVVVPKADNTLKHVGDASAPGKYWITTIPDNELDYPRRPFHPACYNQSGTLIWQGSDRMPMDRYKSCAWAFGTIACALFAAGLRKPKHDG